MGTRIHQHRAALLHRLEEKYSQKLKNTSTNARKNKKASLDSRGMQISQYEFLDYEIIN